MMINVLSADLPGRCITLNHCNASAGRMRNTVMPVAGQAHHQENHMMKLDKMARTSLAMGAVIVALSGCQKQEGPAEQAGKQLDQTTEKVGEQIEKAGESIQDTAQGDKK
jgi:uncharacterized protein YllA (UPF0747 family)